MNLTTGELINRGRAIPCTITPTVIARVEAIGKHDKVRSLRFKGRHGTELQAECFGSGPTGVDPDDKHRPQDTDHMIESPIDTEDEEEVKKMMIQRLQECVI